MPPPGEHALTIPLIILAAGQMHDIIVLVGQVGALTQCGIFIGVAELGEVFSITCYHTVPARIVRIQIQSLAGVSNDVLSLHEVKVFERRVGKYSTLGCVSQPFL